MGSLDAKEVLYFLPSIALSVLHMAKLEMPTMTELGDSLFLKTPQQLQ